MNLWYKKFQKEKKTICQRIFAELYMQCNVMIALLLTLFLDNNIKGGCNIMNIGNQILSIRKEN